MYPGSGLTKEEWNIMSRCMSLQGWQVHMMGISLSHKLCIGLLDGEIVELIRESQR